MIGQDKILIFFEKKRKTQNETTVAAKNNRVGKQDGVQKKSLK